MLQPYISSCAFNGFHAHLIQSARSRSHFRLSAGLRNSFVGVVLAGHAARALCTRSSHAGNALPKRAQRPPQVHTDAFPTPEQIQLQTIAIARSPYKERFGCPRQPTVTEGVVGGEAADCTLEFHREEKIRFALQDLEGFEFIWVISYLHMNEGWSARVTPPRGPRKKRGLFATRAPHRPNHIGMSACRLVSVDTEQLRVFVRGLDLLDGTPVLDIKPYVPYCDSFPGCFSASDTEPLMQATHGLMPPTGKGMPSPICGAHGAFMFVVIVAVAMAIWDALFLQTWWVLPLALVTPFFFVLVYLTGILALPQFGLWWTSSRLQIPLMQHPDYMLSRIVMPWVNFGQGLNMCSNSWCQELRVALGKTYVMAGMVGFADYEAVAFTLKSSQVRTSYLGAQPLTNLPKVDREIFLLGLANGEKGNFHDKFVACFYHYMFNVGFAERVKSEKAKRFWNQLVEDYKNMPHGEGEQFYNEDDKGLRGFFIRYFFYVMLETDTEDPEIMKDLVAMMRGDSPIGWCYLWPMAVANLYGSVIKAVDDRIFNSAVMTKFVEGEEKFGKMTRLELTRLTTCIMRLAAITGTMQLAKTVTGGLTMPPFADMDKIDLAAEWDKLDLNDTRMLENFCLEVARLFPPVSSVHHIATEPFSVVLQGETVDFPAGTKILVPTNLAMTEKETWGVNVFKFDPTRPDLREKNMVFANVGKDGSRICPGMNLALDTCVEILRVLGKVRREGQ